MNGVNIKYEVDIRWREDNGLISELKLFEFGI